MNTVQIPFADLHVDPANARLHGPRNIEAIKANLIEFGQYQPLVVQKSTMRIIVGNGRYEALKQLREEGRWQGETVDCVVADVDDMKAALLSIADNRSAELAEWDFEALSKTLRVLIEGDQKLDDFGWNAAELEPLLAAEWKPEAPRGQEGNNSNNGSTPPAQEGHLHHLSFDDEQYALIRGALECLREESRETKHLSDAECLVRICAANLKQAGGEAPEPTAESTP